MIDIHSRYSVAKVATASLGPVTLRVPNVLFSETQDRDEYAGQFEALLISGAVDTDKVQFVAPQNEMIRGERKASFRSGMVVMPNYIPFSSLIENIETSYERDRNADVFIAVGRNEKVAPELGNVKSELVDLSNAPELSRDPYDLAQTIVSARGVLGINRLLYVPGVATPQNLSMLVYSGADITDSSSTDLSALTGHVFVDGISYPASALREGICSCPACMSDAGEKAVWHNRYQLLSELMRCRVAIATGSLREYVESRAVVSPWNTEFLRYLDSLHNDFFEKYAPNANVMIRAGTSQSLTRPEIMRYAQRISERYKPPPLKIALLVPCSHRKPYFLSRSHRLFLDAVRASRHQDQVHLITVTSPLGVVPEELETVFPAASYDIPVTGHWSHEEKERSVALLNSVISKGGYELVISHLADEREFVNQALDSAGVHHVDTSKGDTRSAESLRRLTEAINSAGEIRRIPWEERMKCLLSNISSFQFGEAGREILNGANLSGRYPNVRITRGQKQLGMLTGQRGVISLTLDGADALHGSVDGYTVEIEDFRLIGNLFAVGVARAGDLIRIGDETLISRKGSVVAVGVASMSASEMNEKKKGEAVHVRHVRRDA